MLYTIEIETPEKGIGVAIRGAIDGLFCILPFITMALLVGMIFTGIGAWFFYLQEQETKED